jgi:glutathione reductase (NADPH)
VTKDDGSTQLLSGKHILIACGGEPSVPPIPGAELAVTSDGFFDLETQPKKAAVIGAGYIAVEMAGIFNGLGTDTSLFFRGETVLRRGFDKYIVDALMKSMEAHGPNLFPGSTPVALEKADDGTITVVMKDGQRQGGYDCVLMAIGRKPVTDLLNLGAAGLSTNNRGYIEVDAFENTKVENIYCLGDASTTGYELTPVAIAAGRRLADRLFGGAGKARLEYRNIATVVFSHPPIGTIGYTEDQAREAFGSENVTTKQARFSSMIYSFNPEDNKVKTALKLVMAGPEETVVGLHCIGPASDEMVQGFSVAIKMGATRRDFESAVAIHPTISEEFVTMGGWGQKKDEAGDAKPWLAPYCDEPEAKPFVTPKLLLGAAIGVIIGGLTATFFRAKI